jgi:phosphatidylserine/phosphatidylglycerophosphate/cardiolipin synthase-like enzyme
MLEESMEVLYDSNKANMHHKVFIVDKSIVITGSYNPTNNGNTRNDENILIIHDPEIADLFNQEFESVWSEALASS